MYTPILNRSFSAISFAKTCRNQKNKQYEFQKENFKKEEFMQSLENKFNSSELIPNIIEMVDTIKDEKVINTLDNFCHAILKY